ncbi:SusC/RagA family TonB-linked outer membrane protein [Arcicella aquatica]|uniref:SusC/RagA family TonB-linked outer membrane protein n=1 Tax=Arcicella aquatica TaxID=217141 RepID=A0ABU5QQL0_9BACT|nr:SusC/RagA family TonB-linked outer membrane protein [Arcicella aquatica]MEA5259377.1 SusC/RagA family TonB-linked outer membrane protein [Arcicella aquatica]
MKHKILLNHVSLFFIALLMLSNVVLAQDNVLTGKVIEKNGDVIPGVSISIKGTTRGTTTDGNGVFKLPSANDKMVLVFRYIGFATQEIVVGNRTTLDVTLLPENRQLEEVVVTALGIKKEARSIGYTTQDVKGEDLVKAREPNPINSLTGKIAGLTVSSSAEMLGRPQLILRGNSDLLFVVDGVPINSDTWNISSDDIETYSVLKGPNAAALYGFRGQNGAILITTKKGSKDKRQFQVDFNSSTMAEPSFLAVPTRQSEYGYGVNYQYAYGNKTYDEDGKFRRTNIWGPRFEGQNVPQYNSPVDPVTGIRQGTPWLNVGKDNFARFMETGIISTNNIALSASGEKYDLRLSIANNYQKGMAPNTKLNINNFNINAGYNFTDRLRLEGNINLSLQNSPNIPEPSSGPEGYTYIFNVYGSSSWDIADMRDYYKGPQGKPGVQQYYAEYGRENNPYFMAYEWLREHKKTDVYGYAKLSYKINEFLNFSARTQITTWNQFRTEKLPYSMITYKTPDLRQGDYREDRRNLLENNSDFLLSFNKPVTKDLTISAIAGANLRTYSYNSSWASTDFLIVPGVYDFSNSKYPVKAYNYRADMEVASAYYTADFTYKNFLTLGTTGRIDKLSTLPADNRNIFYPSVSLSTVVSDYINLPQTISFFKLRGSYANVKGGLTQSTIGTAYQAVTGQSLSSGLIGYGAEIVSAYDGPSYDNQNSYNINTSIYNNTPIANYSGTIANPALQSFSVTSYEVGFDMKFLKNRLSLDATYFTSINGPQIFPLPVASSSGYYNHTINGVTTQKNGWEVSLNGSVLKNPNGLNWNVLANFSTYKETLKEIYGGETSIYLSGPDHVFHIGDRLDGYYDYKFLRNSEGKIIYSSNGVPLVPPTGTNNKQLLGNTNPDFVWALNNKFSYKDFNFSFQVDGRVGGVINDRVWAYQVNSGTAMESVTGALGEARLKEWQSTALGTKTAVPAYVGDGVVVSSGTIRYDAAGNIANSSELSFAPNTKAVTVQSYMQGVYNAFQYGEPYLISKTYMKLREVVIGYTVPARLLGNNKFIRNASVSLVGRNLLYFAERTDFDLDQYGAGYNASNRSTQKDPGLQSATTRRYGINISLTF